LTEWWRTTLSDYLDKVIISQRLVEDPCVIVGAEHGYDPYMEKITAAQAYSSSDKQHPFMKAKRILEINPSHPAIKELLERVKEGPDSDTADLATLLYETALLRSGYNLHDPYEFAKRFSKIFNGALGIPKDAKIEDVELDLEDDTAKPTEIKEGEQIDFDEKNTNQGTADNGAEEDDSNHRRSEHDL